MPGDPRYDSMPQPGRTAFRSEHDGRTRSRGGSRILRRLGARSLAELGAVALIGASSSLAASAPATAQSTTREWTVVPDRLLVVERSGATSRCGWFVTLGDRLIALRSVAGTPVPDRRDHPLAELGAVIERQPNHQPMPMPGLLVTVDGQRLPGEPRISGGRLLWRNRWTGEVAIALEDLAALRLAPDGEIPEAKDGDVIELVNGDRVGGLIASIGVDVSIEDPAAPVTPGATEREAVRIPLERVRSIRLLPAPVAASGPRAWFADGTVASGRIVADEQSGGMRFIPSLPASSRSEESSREAIRIRPEDLRAYLPEIGSVVPLPSLPATEVLATGTWPSYAPPELVTSRSPGPADAPDLVFHGPGAARWSVPDGPWTLVAEAMPHAPDAKWTSFDLVVRDGAREVYRRTFDADTGPVELKVPIDSASLAIEVTEGDRGPIADAIRLRRAMLLRR